MTTAAKELQVSDRHLRRYLQELEIQPARIDRTRGNNVLYILGANDMERLRKLKAQHRENFYHMHSNKRGARPGN